MIAASVLKKRIILLLCIFYTISSYAQRITVSPNIDTRNLNSYEMLGEIGDLFLLYMQDGRKHFVHGFDENLKKSYSRELSLDGGKRMDIYAMVPLDTAIMVYYGRKKKDKFQLYGTRYSKYLKKIESDTFYYEEDVKFKLPEYSVSADKKYTLLYYTYKRTHVRFLLFDNTAGHMLWDTSIEDDTQNFSSDLLDVFVGNSGQVHMVTADKKDDNETHFIKTTVENGVVTHSSTSVMLEGTPQDIQVVYNHTREELIYTGIYSLSSGSNPAGYYFAILPIASDGKSFTMVKFDSSFMIDLYGNKLRKKKDLDEFVVRHVLSRTDGGFILCIEKHKEYARKNPYRVISRFRDGLPNALGIDIYDEDIALINVHPDGEEFWKRVLFKKQFSQDNNYLFSSFFIFKTDTRLRLIYNDDISKNNIVSEYVVNPLGDIERNSLFNTEYQNLKLRFVAGLQTSSHTCIVPSEHSNYLNLVKIDFREP